MYASNSPSKTNFHSGIAFSYSNDISSLQTTRKHKISVDARTRYSWVVSGKIKGNSMKIRRTGGDKYLWETDWWEKVIDFQLLTEHVHRLENSKSLKKWLNLNGRPPCTACGCIDSIECKIKSVTADDFVKNPPDHNCWLDCSWRSLWSGGHIRATGWATSYIYRLQLHATREVIMKFVTHQLTWVSYYVC